MTLITTDELARGLALVVFGSAAGGVAIAVPGSPLWLLPAAIGLGASALTVPEIRDELRAAAPGLLAAPERARALLDDVRQRGPRALLNAAPAAGDTPPSHPAVTPAARQRGAQGAGRPLPPREWLRAVNDRPDDNPHMTVVGPSGTGKTTFVSAALAERPGRVVVLTPKVSPAAWRGAEVVTLDDDLSYDPIAAALDDLQTEARARAKRLQRGEPLEPMTIVLDELPELHSEVPGLGKFAVRLSRWGRELQMRQVVLATSDDALNIPGWAATRSNYVRVELEKPTPDGRRPAWLDDGRARHRLDLGAVKHTAERAQLQPWRGAPAPSTGTTRLVRRAEQPAQAPARAADPAVSTLALDWLAASLAEEVPARQDAEGTAVNPVPGNGSNDGGAAHSSVIVEPGNGGNVTVNATLIAPGATAKDKTARTAAERALVELYRALGAEGVTFAKAYAQHKGTKEIVFTAWQEGRATKEGK